MAVASLIATANLWPGRGVDADLETLGVNVVGQGLHIGKARISDDISVGIAGTGPAFVDNDVFVARCSHSTGDHGVRHLPYGSVVKLVVIMIPAIPAHRRRADEAVVGLVRERRQGQPFRIDHFAANSLQSALSFDYLSGADPRRLFIELKFVSGLADTFIKNLKGLVAELGTHGKVQFVALKCAGQRDLPIRFRRGDGFARLLQREKGGAAVGHGVLPKAIKARLGVGLSK